MNGGFALDAFGDIDIELDAVVTHGDTGRAIYGRTTGRAEDAGESESVGYFWDIWIYKRSRYLCVGGVFLVQERGVLT